VSAVAADAFTAAPVLERLSARADELRRQWQSHTLFGYFVCDDFLPADLAEALLAVYPPPDLEGWDQTTYPHQRKKFTRRSGFEEPIERFFEMTASPEFLERISSITGIRPLHADPLLVGGGLHQSIRGAFLDVHVDFNVHPETRLERRLNLLLYMNKDWKREYEGCLELWDMNAKKCLAEIAPVFNRAVLFETNDVSYHGHPKPLNCPQNMSRKSLAVYYYTPTAERVAPEHSTLYRQTTGARGYVKTLAAAVQAMRERISGGTVALLADNLGRRLRGLPPKQRY